MKALVTGASGFLGRNIVAELVKQGWTVNSLVRDPAKADCKKLDHSSIFVGDVRFPETLKQVFFDVNCVFHTAAKVSDWGKWSDFESHTIMGTKNIIEGAVKAGVTSFVHISSVDVYDRGYIRNASCQISEDATLVSDTDNYYYARAKMMAEKAVAEYQSSLDIIIVRPGTIYGPGDTTILPRVVEFLKDPLTCLIKDYNPILGLIYIDDLVDLSLKACHFGKPGLAVYNAVNDESVRLRQFLMKVSKENGLTLPRREIPYWLAKVAVRLIEAYASARKIEPIMTSASLDFLTLEQNFSISRVKEDFGWRPKVSFDEGIKKALAKGGESGALS